MTYGEIEWTDMLLDPSESDQEIESHVLYKEEQDVTHMIPVPKQGSPRDSSLTPITSMVVDTMGLKKSRVLIKLLFDPGSTKSLISRKALPRWAQLIQLTSAKQYSRPYSVPHVHQDAFRKELEQLVKIGVLSKTGTSELC